ncbi:hypothetical protein CAOG_03696 [Capsaspora owczarzaki ATCC 30864]|uniref:YbaK/aminoacyl-tRNA synthetase-associated domain-containing protein n=1 Tax=Capsaspora owczarzaki (strain ATCC 30864) TaxID=595528 RepID=A0A0D2UCM5_CAPO3|nr:hypothetical protein CAOG_03696 [Capsaspora owczarzaki ATCC 30864]KJE92796.1 hypothetical protein CAOG_003696 [Capsaspora owczarzaki ATCC 30864]|eukprot:XP_004363424.1 hypothetical protein CAOG_03696 [Capsaspora owczarzaki ATCC 30864]
MDSTEARQATLLAQLEQLSTSITLLYSGILDEASVPVKFNVNRALVLSQGQTSESKDAAQPKVGEPEAVQRVRRACESAALHMSLRCVPSDYYDWTLERRRNVLQAPSIHHLCKSIVLENTRMNKAANKADLTGIGAAELAASASLDPRNSKYYCVIVQYTTKFDSDKMVSYIRNLHKPVLSTKTLNYRLVDPEVSFALTGFDKNGVCPIGMTRNVPILVSRAILSLQPPVMYLGAGDIDWKLVVSVDDFLRTTGAQTADLITS